MVPETRRNSIAAFLRSLMLLSAVAFHLSLQANERIMATTNLHLFPEVVQ